ncbi:MAG TPA: hypothetical protein VN956_16690, partial [Pyrinomonadaceae bacterium]|nr:hypothetical protein [Pyrinomonadaceae bacterium]
QIVRLTFVETRGELSKLFRGWHKIAAAAKSTKLALLQIAAPISELPLLQITPCLPLAIF